MVSFIEICDSNFPTLLSFGGAVGLLLNRNNNNNKKKKKKKKKKNLISFSINDF